MNRRPFAISLGIRMDAVNPRLRLATLGFAILIAVTGLYMFSPLQGRGATVSDTRTKLNQKIQQEGVLTNEITRYSGRINGLQGKISKLQRREGSLKVDLDRKQSRQKAIEVDLDKTRGKLERLRARFAESQTVLAARLVAIYKSDQPDVLTVVLNSNGFEDLIERANFLQRIARQDRAIITRVRELRGTTKRETVKLASLEAEASRLVAQVRERHQQVASARGELDQRSSELGGVRSKRQAVLAGVKKDRKGLQEDLAAMERSQGQVQGVLRNIPAGPIKNGSGALIWPIDGTFTSPFGMRWGRLHAGIDISAAIGTPIRAADGGRVAFAGGMGGYGNYTCIQHNSSLSTCYAHQSSIGVSVGQSVRKAQVIGAVGSTGHSTGPHLHFETRVNGNPVDPMGYL